MLDALAFWLQLRKFPKYLESRQYETEPLRHSRWHQLARMIRLSHEHFALSLTLRRLGVCGGFSRSISTLAGLRYINGLATILSTQLTLVCLNASRHLRSMLKFRISTYDQIASADGELDHCKFCCTLEPPLQTITDYYPYNSTMVKLARSVRMSSKRSIAAMSG
jgi:hypothetical protein